MKYLCQVCNAETNKPTGEYNRALRKGYIPTCSKKCGGARRRTNKPAIQKKLEKRLYDMQYREVNKEYRKKQKSEYFQRTYDPIKAAELRKLTMPRHVEYCRQSHYKEYKRQYDQKYRAKEEYGEFWESFLTLQKIEKEVDDRMDWTEIRTINGVLNKKQTRRRDYERINRC